MLKKTTTLALTLMAMLAFFCPADAERRSEEAQDVFCVEEGTSLSGQAFIQHTAVNNEQPDTMIASKPRAREGFISAVAIDPIHTNILYAGTQQGIIKTTDCGTNWTTVSNGLTHKDVLTIAIDPVKTSTLYAGTREGAFKSNDCGGRWYPMEKGLSHTPVLAIAVDPARPGTVYLIARDAAFVFGVFAEEDRRGEVVSGSRDCAFKSTNGGARWSSLFGEMTDLRSNLNHLPSTL